MRLVQFKLQGKNHVGMKTDKGIFDLTSAQQSLPSLIDEILKLGEQGKHLVEKVFNELGHNPAYYLKEENLEYLPCLSFPEKVVCIGLNYAKHAAESGMDKPEAPILFSKFANALTGHKQAIYLPPTAGKVDYEAELAVIIGKEACQVTEEEAEEYIYGYTVSNDLSARDLQFASSQWLLGKSCDGFAPIGPELITKEEIKDPGNLEIKTYVNGEIRQHSNTSDMIFTCHQIISYVSHYMTLKPGDIILTGTPEGVIMGYSEEKQEWLKEGDKVRIEIEELCVLENSFTRKR